MPVRPAAARPALRSAARLADCQHHNARRVCAGHSAHQQPWPAVWCCVSRCFRDAPAGRAGARPAAAHAASRGAEAAGGRALSSRRCCCCRVPCAVCARARQPLRLQTRALAREQAPVRGAVLSDGFGFAGGMRCKWQACGGRVHARRGQDACSLGLLGSRIGSTQAPLHACMHACEAVRMHAVGAAFGAACWRSSSFTDRCVGPPVVLMLSVHWRGCVRTDACWAASRS